MSRYEHYELLWRVAHLQEARRLGKLVFVLGAGINTPYRVPTWQSLLTRLLSRASVTQRQALDADETQALMNGLASDPLHQAAIIRLGYPSEVEWCEAIAECLVAEVNPATGGLPLSEIARIVVDQARARRSEPTSVITFNYDRLLEDAIDDTLAAREIKLKAQSVSTKEDFERSMKVPGIFVYHLHGMADPQRGDTILSADSYLQVLLDPGAHWSWHCMNRLIVGRGGVPFFIGLSLADPSLRLMLGNWQKQGVRLTGVYVASPVHSTDPNLPIHVRRERAYAYRLVSDLHSQYLRQLKLFPYRLTSWDELVPILQEL